MLVNALGGVFSGGEAQATEAPAEEPQAFDAGFNDGADFGDVVSDHSQATFPGPLRLGRTKGDRRWLQSTWASARRLNVCKFWWGDGS